jgi:hypothetical protein
LVQAVLQNPEIDDGILLQIPVQGSSLLQPVEMAELPTVGHAPLHIVPLPKGALAQIAPQTASVQLSAFTF